MSATAQEVRSQVWSLLGESGLWGCAIRIAIEEVAFLSASVAGVPAVTSTLTFEAMSSPMSRGSRE